MGRKKNRERGQPPKKENWPSGTTTPTEGIPKNTETSAGKEAVADKSIEIVDEKIDGGTLEGWKAVQAEPELDKGVSKDAEIKLPESNEPKIDDKRLGISFSMAANERAQDEKPKTHPPRAEPFHGKKPNTSINMITDEKIQDEKPKLPLTKFLPFEEKKPDTPVSMIPGSKIPDATAKVSTPRVQPSNTKSQNKNLIPAKIVINETDVVLQALNYLDWDNKNKGGHSSGLLHFNRISQEKFDQAMKGYYETPQSTDEDFIPPIGAIKEFTDLYRASRLMLDEIRQAKGGSLNQGDVRALSMVIMNHLTRLTHPRIVVLDISQRLRLKSLLQRNFRAHAKLDPMVIADDDDEDMAGLKDAFTEGLKRVLDSLQEALPNGSRLLRLLLLVMVFACAGTLYYTIWRFSSTFAWDSSTVSRVFNNTKFTGYATSANSSSKFLPLDQQLKLYKLDVNSTAEVYENCDLKTRQAVDLVLRRTGKLATDLKMIEMTIKLSKLRLLKPFFQIFNIASEEILLTTALGCKGNGVP
ncbi:hypothetical protein N431DRAFT_512718 [Stipitochalara longipes BDJ]|nr:hypothetical protein N431DRAFT_512718 [Stipitochalara longipes BDJ]